MRLVQRIWPQVAARLHAEAGLEVETPSDAETQLVFRAVDARHGGPARGALARGELLDFVHVLAASQVVAPLPGQLPAPVLGGAAVVGTLAVGAVKYFASARPLGALLMAAVPSTWLVGPIVGIAGAFFLADKLPSLPQGGRRSVAAGGAALSSVQQVDEDDGDDARPPERIEHGANKATASPSSPFFYTGPSVYHG